MTIEQKIFKRMRFDAERLTGYGFTEAGASYLLSVDFMDGNFTAEIVVNESDSLRGRVIDRQTGEEYVQLRMPNLTGAYVGAVREAYEELLRDIADKCCIEVSFASEQSNRIADAILQRYAVEPDFPWEDSGKEEYGVFRHGASRRWFALIMNIDRRLLDKKSEEEYIDVMNLKTDESIVRDLCKTSGIYPAYHMNHKKWISVTLDETLPDDAVMDLVQRSHELTSDSAGVLNERLVREVLEIADSIPQGRVMSYGQIAKAIGRPKNARLIGKIMSMADRYGNHPCHRVVNHAGRTVPDWDEQRSLLESEGVEFLKNGCVNMKKFQLVE